MCYNHDMKNYDIIIVGAGASGCLCALQSSKNNKKILLIDKLKTAGKKLMVTGNGRCNLTNLNIFPSEKYFNQNIDEYIKRYSPSLILEYFKKMGLICYADNENRVYPISNSAKSVIDILNNQLLKYNNITLALDTEFEAVEYINEKYEVKTNKGNFFCEKLVIASGGKTADNVAKKFGIQTKPFTPSLVSLKTQSTRTVENIRINPATIKLKVKGQNIEESGEVLFKDSGISGIVAFNISSFFARAGKFDGIINIDILPNFSEKEIFEILKRRKSLSLPINKMFDGIFLPAVGYLILNICKLDEDRTTDKLSDNEIKLIAKTIKNLTFEVKSCYSNNQVYSGGVLLSSLSKNLESKEQKNLYFCGEVCDVDGKCGGYNLQWAWTSGLIVGDAL